jgi:glycosyltransferase involved in cell wall biosynthesis
MHFGHMDHQLSILAIAYVFPPDAGSGTFRTLYFTNAWANSGNNVTVVTVRERDFQSTALVDAKLCEQIAPSIQVVRAAARRPLDMLIKLRDKMRGRKMQTAATRLQPSSTAACETRRTSVGSVVNDAVSSVLTFPDAHSGWILDAVRSAKKVMRNQHVDCIYASGGPWSGILAATLLHKLTKVPLVLDFRDPWASNPNLGEGRPFIRRAHARCESFCVNSASRVITNTEELRQDFIARYPQLDPATFVCITNGFEELPPFEAAANTRFTVVHAGALYLSRNPQRFLQALTDAAREELIPRERILVQFVGGVPDEDPQIASLIAQLGSTVEVIPRLPHSQALEMQKNASALLLFQAGFPLQVPRKLYEYFSLRRPILAVTEANSATARILRDVGMEYLAEDSVEQIKEALLKLYRDWDAGRMLAANEERLQAYSNRRLAMRLRDEMAAAVGRS